MEALRLAVLGHQTDAEPARIERRPDLDGTAIERDSPPLRPAAEPKMVSRISVRPEPQQAANAENLAGPHIETHIAQHLPPAAAVRLRAATAC